MTIGSEVVVTSQATDGSSTSFPYNFKILTTDGLQVTVRDAAGVDTVKTYGVHYELTGVGDDAGGTVDFTTAPADGGKVVAEATLPLTQAETFPEGEGFPSQTHEDAHDARVRQIQLVNALAGRATRSRSGDGGGLELPLTADRAGMWAGWDADGAWTALAGVSPDDVAISAYMETVLAASDEVSALALLAAGTGLVEFLQGTRPLGRLGAENEFYSWCIRNAKTFNSSLGADMAVTVEEFLADAVSNGYDYVEFPAGRFSMSANFLFRTGMIVQGAGRFLTQFHFDHESGFVPKLAAGGGRTTNFELADMGAYGTDGEDDAANTTDHVGWDLKLCTHGRLTRLYSQGFSDFYAIDGSKVGSVSGASNIYADDCYAGIGAADVPNHGNNNYPRNLFRIHSSTGHGPDACLINRFTGYIATAVDSQAFDGDAATTVFTMAALASSQKCVDARQLQVFVDDKMQTLTTDYTVDLTDPTRPEVTFGAAPASGTDNVDITFLPIRYGCKGMNFEEAAGCHLRGFAISGCERAISFNEQKCSAGDGYAQICGSIIHGTANSSLNTCKANSIHLTQATVHRVIEDGGSDNDFGPEVWRGSLRLAADFVATAANGIPGTQLGPTCIADGHKFFEFMGRVKLAQNGGAPATLSATFDLQYFDVNLATPAWVNVGNWQHTVSSPSAADHVEFVHFILVDKDQVPFRSADQSPSYRIHVTPGANTEVTVFGGADCRLGEFTLHA